MLKVAITGNIASGKSQVEKFLLIKGYKVADTDKINHYILMTNMGAIKEIKAAFSTDDITDENGNISREKLGQVVFFDNEKKLKLEEILHKRIKERVNMFFHENAHKNIVFVSVPLLYETNQQDNYDKVIFISADEDVRLRRLMERNNYTEEYARKRIEAQGKEDEKLKQADYVIYNNSDFANLKRQINIVLGQIVGL